MKIAFPAEMISDINMQYQKLLILMTGSSAPTAEIIPAFTMMLNRPRVIRVRGSDIICSTGRIKRFAIQRTVPAAKMTTQLPLNSIPDGKRIEVIQSDPVHISHLINNFIFYAANCPPLQSRGVPLSFLPKQAFYIDAFIAVFELDVNKIDGPGVKD